MQKLKHGMIGGGIGAFIGDAHRRASRISNDYVLLGGVFDVDFEKSKQFAAQEGIDPDRCYPSVDDFIQGELALPEENRIQIVSIVTPNSLHFEFASKLLKNGFHVMCEKPMTMTVDEALRLEEIVNSKGLVFGLTHTYTGYPMVREMKERIAAGELGKIQRVDAQYYQGWLNPALHGGPEVAKEVWRLNPEKSGISSAMGDIGVHAFNLIEYTTGLQINRVLADLNNFKEEIKLDLDGTVLIRTDAGAKGVIRVCQVATGEENNLTIAIYGSKGSFKWSQENPNYLVKLSDDQPIQVSKPGNPYNQSFAGQSHTMPPGHPEGIYEAVANIYKGVAQAIRGEKVREGAFPTVKDGVRGMQFIHSVVRSNSESNKWIDLE